MSIELNKRNSEINKWQGYDQAGEYEYEIVRNPKYLTRITTINLIDTKGGRAGENHN